MSYHAIHSLVESTSSCSDVLRVSGPDCELLIFTYSVLSLSRGANVSS